PAPLLAAPPPRITTTPEMPTSPPDWILSCAPGPAIRVPPALTLPPDASTVPVMNVPPDAVWIVIGPAAPADALPSPPAVTILPVTITVFAERFTAPPAWPLPAAPLASIVPLT